jgi:hypothetical protein
VILDANGPTLVVSDEVDENGVIEFALENNDAKKLVYGALTVNQATVLAQHLLDIIRVKNTKAVGVGSRVRVTSTNTTFLGVTGVVILRRENSVRDLVVELDGSGGVYAFEAWELGVIGEI